MTRLSDKNRANFYPMSIPLDKTSESFYPLDRSLDKNRCCYYPMTDPLDNKGWNFSPLTNSLDKTDKTRSTNTTALKSHNEQAPPSNSFLKGNAFYL